MKVISEISKRKMLFVIISVILTVLVTVYISNSRKVEILGFANENEKIIIKFPYKCYKFTVKGDNEGGTLRYFYRETRFFSICNKSRISIQIDSSNVNLLDTLILLTKSNRLPIISFQNPRKISFKRCFFIIDKKDIVIP
jgi:hypothetical protein